MAKCLRPIVIRNPSKIYEVLGKHFYLEVPCGRCPNCLQRRQQDWSIRILWESRHCYDLGGCSYVTTLTYDDSHLPDGYKIDFETGESTNIGELRYSDVQSFLKCLRKHLDTYFNAKLRVFTCGEYGDSFDRPHYHICLFFPDHLFRSEDLRPIIEKFWFYGHVGPIDPISEAVSEYVAKYSTKRLGQEYGDLTPPFAKMSQGIGKYFIEKNEKFYQDNDQHFTYSSSGTAYALPRYYSEKIFDEMSLSNYSLQVKAKADALYNIQKLWNPRFEIEQRLANERYEDLFWRKLKLAKHNVCVL